MSCDRAWAYRYIVKLREPEVEWNDRKAPPRMRSRALGKAVHHVFEVWQSNDIRLVNWRDLPGQIALSGAHHVPHPERVHEARVEAQLGTVPLPPSEHADALTVAYELHGVLWAGKRDLLVSAPGEFIRLGIDAADGWCLYDYKTTASIERYALTPTSLAVDPQACLYVAATCDELGLDELPVRWLYLETKKVRRALPVDAVIRAHDAKARVEEYAVKARRLDTIPDVESADMNTGACGEYGGCYYHVSNGGPCNARRSIGGLIQARVPKKDRDMGLSNQAKTAFDGFKKGNGAAQSPPTTDVQAEPEAAAETVSEDELGRPVPPATPVTRTPRKSRAVAAKPTGAVATIAQLSAELVQAQAGLEAAQAHVNDLLVAIREACG